MSRRFNTKKQDGFVALISAIIISAVLLIISTSLSFSGFYGRYDILESELKNRSTNIAEACADMAMLKVTNDSSYNPNNEVIPIDNANCTIKSVTNNGAQITILIQENYSNYYTNLRILVDSSTFSVISWQEIESL